MSARRRKAARRPTLEKGGGRPTSSSEASKHTKERQPRQKIRRLWLFRLIALTVVPATLLLLLEFSLRLFGFGYPTGFALKQRAMGQTIYVQNREFSRRFFPKEIARHAIPFTLSAPKKQGTYRIFVLGGSAAQGTPDHTFGFGRILEVQLRDRFPGVGFEFVNAAVVAINSHVVLEIAKHCAKLQPDLFIVYLGHNEVVGPFGAGTILAPLSPSLSVIRAGLLLKSTRVGQLLELLSAAVAHTSAPRIWEGMPMFLEKQTPADAPAMEIVYRHFRRNLSDLCRVAQENRIPTIVCTVATNLKDFPPLASLHRPDLSDGERKKWDETYQKGVALETQGDCALAVQFYLAAAEIDDHYADLHYRLGRCYWTMKDYLKARQYLTCAREYDTLRFRADTRINNIIRLEADGKSSRGVYLVDIENAFEENSPHSTPGEELFHEHVHLNFKGNFLLAKTVLQRVEKILPDWVKENARGNGAPLTQAECAERLAFTDFDRYRVPKKVLDSFIKKPPFTNQLYHTELLAKLEKELDDLTISAGPESLGEVDAQYRSAIQNRKSDVWLRFNYSVFLASAAQDFKAAERELRVFMHSFPDVPDALNNLGLALMKQGKLNEAKTFFNKVLQVTPSDIAAHGNMGSLLTFQGKHDEAISHYRQALEIKPDLAQTHYNLGWALSSQGKVDEAISHYRQAVQLDPAHAEAHYNLGNLLFTSRDEVGEAIRHYRQAIEVKPAYAKAHYNLGLALSVTARGDAAIKHFRDAMRLKPDWPAPLQRVAWILATHSDSNIREGNRAIHLARRACELTEYQDAAVLDTLGAAYASAGRFDRAVTTAQTALTLASAAQADGLANAIRKRLELYRQGKPYQEPAQTRCPTDP